MNLAINDNSNIKKTEEIKNAKKIEANSSRLSFNNSKIHPSIEIKDELLTLSHPQSQVNIDVNSFSKLTDIDMAKDMIKSNKSDILSSPFNAMSAQANQSVESVIKLLE